jgi:hypothetical protein
MLYKKIRGGQTSPPAPLLGKEREERRKGEKVIRRKRRIKKYGEGRPHPRPLSLARRGRKGEKGKRKTRWS